MAYTSLSVGQIACLRLLPGCQDTDQIGDVLGISAATVIQQLDGACRRLGVESWLDAAMVAARLGLIPDC